MRLGAIAYALRSNSARGSRPARFVSGTPLTHRVPGFSEGKEGPRAAALRSPTVRSRAVPPRSRPAEQSHSPTELTAQRCTCIAPPSRAKPSLGNPPGLAPLATQPTGQTGQDGLPRRDGIVQTLRDTMWIVDGGRSGWRSGWRFSAPARRRGGSAGLIQTGACSAPPVHATDAGIRRVPPAEQPRIRPQEFTPIGPTRNPTRLVLGFLGYIF